MRCPHLIVFAAVLTGCARPLIPVDCKNYELHDLKKAPVGAVMIEYEDQELVRGNWVGLARSSSGWEERIDRYKEQFIYAGRSGNSIFINYREYENGGARSDMQRLEFDIGTSAKIAFKNYEMRIWAADDARVEFVVLNDSGIE